MELWKEKRKWLDDIEDERVMVVSHRGKFASSVIENTSLAFLTAISQGADMVEMDLARTRDGRLVGHHDSKMDRLFHKSTAISAFSLEELKQMEIYNCFGEPCVESIESFDEILDMLKGRTLLVLDKCWDCWEEVYRLLEEKQMTEQAIFKFYVEDQAACHWAMEHSNCMFIPMLGDITYLDRVETLKRYTQLPALEILLEKETDPIFSEDIFSRLRKRKIKVWCNSLSYSRKLIYGAGYDDLRSLRFGGQCGWGKLIEHGVSIIQTDWPYELKRYLIEQEKKEET